MVIASPEMSGNIREKFGKPSGLKKGIEKERDTKESVDSLISKPTQEKQLTMDKLRAANEGVRNAYIFALRKDLRDRGFEWNRKNTASSEVGLYKIVWNHVVDGEVLKAKKYEDLTDAEIVEMGRNEDYAKEHFYDTEDSSSYMVYEELKKFASEALSNDVSERNLRESIPTSPPPIMMPSPAPEN